MRCPAYSPASLLGRYMGSSKLYKNGRDKGKKGALSQIKVEMQESEAFQSLSASAIRVLLYAIFLNYFAASRTNGRPVFKFTNKTAKEKLGMSSQTYSRAKQELADKGFWEWVRRGGMKGCNGVASEFALTGNWKTWSKN